MASVIEAGPVPASLFGLDPATYRPHAVHDGTRTYPETDCYTDVLIELLHARGDEPLAVLGSLLRLDVENDQWTFFKPDMRDLETLLGVDIHEMQPWRPIPLQVEELLATGRTMTVEVDAWFLPDTAATSYRAGHVKTTIIPEAIDRDAGWLRYFHNAGYYELSGDDYRGIFRVDEPTGGEVLVPYTELVRFDAGPRLSGEGLRVAARAATRFHLDRRAPGDPFARFADRLAADLPGLLDGDEATYHAYAFATVRMAGSGCELLAAHAEWLLPDDPEAGAAFRRIVDGAKLLGFKLARRRAFDPTETLADMGAAWAEATSRLDEALPR